MKFAERLFIVIVTATLTSMAWIIAGSSAIELVRNKEEQPPAEQPAPVVSDPAGSEPDAAEASEATAAEDAAPEAQSVAADSLHREKEPQGDEEGAAQVEQLGPLLVPVLNLRRADLMDNYAGASGQPASPHPGIDIAGEAGTTIQAAAPGTIVKIGFSKASGNVIIVRSPGRQWLYVYSHLDELAKGLQEGQRIRRGQRLGSLGSSGTALATKPHLHFAILRTDPDAAWWEPATPVNPYPLLMKE